MKFDWGVELDFVGTLNFDYNKAIVMDVLNEGPDIIFTLVSRVNLKRTTQKNISTPTTEKTEKEFHTKCTS